MPLLDGTNGGFSIPTMNPAICPICGHTLKPDEYLLARFIPEHNWWVVYHMPAKEPTPDKLTDLQFDLHKSWCGQAGYTMSTSPEKLFQKPK